LFDSKCQLCQDGKATIKIAQVTDKEMSEISLCKVCAEEQGINQPMNKLPQMFGQGVFNFDDEGHLDYNENGAVKCSGCGLTWNAFQGAGLLGCGTCYTTFRNELTVVLRKIHGTSRHIGSRPKSQRQTVPHTKLQKVENELQSAVRNEDFELAAELRDIVRDSQRESDKSGNDGILR